MRRILEGVRVLDLTHFFAGPQATLFLAGLGAEVIRIESPASARTAAAAPPYAGPEGVTLERRTPDDMNVNFLKRQRGKQTITLDLKLPAGKALFFDLVDRADVVVENFSVGVAARLGVDYAAVSARNPRTIYCAISGFGATGPDAAVKAYDPVVQAAAGLMYLTGMPGQPPTKAGVTLSDAVAGTFAMSGIMAALYDRERTGAGQFVDVSMTDCLFALIFDDPIDWYARLGVPARQGNRVFRFSPMNGYETRDGHVIVGAATPAQWTGLLTAIGRPDLGDDPEWASVDWRIANNGQVDALVQGWAADRTTADVVAAARAGGAVAAAIHSPEDLAAWPHLKARDMYETLAHPTFGPMPGVGAPGFPLRFSAAETGYRAPAATPGANTVEVLAELLNLDDAAIAALARDGVI